MISSLQNNVYQNILFLLYKLALYSKNLFKNTPTQQMAFVFKSQSSAHDIYPIKKQILLQDQIDEQILKPQSQESSKINQLSQSSSKIIKGLPSLLNKKKDNSQQNIYQKKQLTFKTTSKENRQIVNIAKLKKQSQNYFFVSKSTRNPYGDILKPIDRNLTCQNFKPKQQDKQLPSMHTTQKFSTFVNRNLRNTASQVQYQFKKPTIPNSEKQLNLQNMIIVNEASMKNQILMNNKLKQNIKVKSTPQTFKTANKKKIDQRKTCSIKRSVSQDKKQKAPICMMTSAQIIKQKEDSKLSKQTKKYFSLKKGPLQSSFYKNQSQSEEQEEQFQKNCTPGPGSYDQMNLHKKKNFRSKKQKFKKIFITPLERFSKSNINFQEVTYVNQEEDSLKKQYSKINAPFLAKSPKFQQIRKVEMPSPGQYNTRQSMEHQIVRKLLKNAHVAQFSSSAPRFKYNLNQSLPGPGDYNIDIGDKMRLQQIRAQLSYFYKSKVDRNLNKSEIIKSCEQNDSVLELLNNSNRQIIHKHQKSFTKDQFFTAPPFLSNKQRFSSNYNIGKTLENTQFSNIPNISPTKKQQKQVSPNKSPFNSTAKRQTSIIVGQGVGVGSYNAQKCKWSKKSYNVNFH